MVLSDENKDALTKATNGTNACLYFLSTIEMTETEKRSGVYNSTVPIKVGISTSVHERMNQYHTYFQCVHILGVFPLSFEYTKERLKRIADARSSAQLIKIVKKHKNEASPFLKKLEALFIENLMSYQAMQRKTNVRRSARKVEWYTVHSGLLMEVAEEIYKDMDDGDRHVYGKPHFFNPPLTSGNEEMGIEIDSLFRREFLVQVDIQTHAPRVTERTRKRHIDRQAIDRIISAKRMLDFDASHESNSVRIAPSPDSQSSDRNGSSPPIVSRTARSGDAGVLAANRSTTLRSHTKKMK